MSDYVVGRSMSVSHTSDEEEEDRSPPRRSVHPLTSGLVTGGGGGPSFQKISLNRMGSSTNELVIPHRKPRGRPPGSKNKPKPPIVLTRESESAMKPTVLEISPKSDIIEMVKQFARRRFLDITILGATGSVSNIKLRQSGSNPQTLTFHGTFDILSLSGTFTAPSLSSTSSSCPGSFSISLAGSQGQVFGGTVAGKAMAATPVAVTVATFVGSTFHRLPSEFDQLAAEDDQEKSNGDGGSSTGMAMSVYGVAAPTPLNCHIPPHQVMTWGSTSRPHPPPY